MDATAADRARHARRFAARRAHGLVRLARRRRRDARRLLNRLLRREDLVELATRYGTDKWGTHRYAQHYERHLQHLRSAPINLLEIGVGGYSNPAEGGRSLRMWKAYFRRAQIFGVDVHDKSALEENRIRIFRADQGDPESLRRVADQIGRIDVIVDDGSHRSDHVITTFETLFPRLSRNGVYCIEDLQTSYWPEFGGGAELDSPGTSMAMLKRLVDGLNYVEWQDDRRQPTYADKHLVAAHFYHNLVILQKGRNAERTQRQRILSRRHAT